VWELTTGTGSGSSALAASGDSAPRTGLSSEAASAHNFAAVVWNRRANGHIFERTARRSRRRQRSRSGGVLTEVGPSSALIVHSAGR
jgi:hypothetical protein